MRVQNTIGILLRKSVAITDSCWIWTGSVKPSGYGQVSWQGHMQRAHRVFYVAFKGPIPPDLVIDHLCKVKRCVNPEHLEAVTQKVNVHRSVGGSAHANALKVVCLKGHPFDADNTMIRGNGHRVCKSCKRQREQNLQRRFA